MIGTAIRSHFVRFDEGALRFVRCRRVSARRAHQGLGVVIILFLVCIGRAAAGSAAVSNRFLVLVFKFGAIIKFAFLFLTRPSREVKDQVSNVRCGKEATRRDAYNRHGRRTYSGFRRIGLSVVYCFVLLCEEGKAAGVVGLSV